MSSRPMGWSITGVAKMAQLRAYYLNGGDMLELVHYQEKKTPKVSGAENDILSSAQITASEKVGMGAWKICGEYLLQTVFAQQKDSIL